MALVHTTSTAGPAGRPQRSARALLGVLTLLLALALPAVASGNSARMGYYWKDDTLPYDTRFTYTYDVLVHPDGAFADNGPHSFAYITGQNKHILWDDKPYGVEVVTAYWGGNGGGNFWLAWLDDTSRYHSIYVAPDATDPHGFLGPHWNLNGLRKAGYMLVEADETGQWNRWLRVKAETVLVAGNPASSEWENRVFLHNPTTDSWDLKGANRFTLDGTAEQVRNYTAARGGGIWASILETYGDGDGQADPRPALKPFGYKNRRIEIVDHGTTSSPPLDATRNAWNDDGAYRVLHRSSGDDREWIGGSKELRRAVARLYNADDELTVAVDGMPVGTVGYGGEDVFDLGWLGEAQTVGFTATNAGGGYSWGFDLFTASESDLGGVDLARYCVAHGHQSAGLVGPAQGTNAAHNWRCQPGNHSIDMNDTCDWQFAGEAAYARALDVNDAYSWRCFNSVASAADVIATGQLAFQDTAGTAGVLGAWGNDQSRPNQLVRDDAVTVGGTVLRQQPGAPSVSDPAPPVLGPSPGVGPVIVPTGAAGGAPPSTPRLGNGPVVRREARAKCKRKKKKPARARRCTRKPRA